MGFSDFSRQIWQQRHRLRMAVFHPLWVLSNRVAQPILARYEIEQSEFISTLTGCCREDVSTTLLEAETTVLGHLAPCSHDSGGTMSLEEAFTLFGLIRLIKPDIVVETGISQGMSSTAILQGLALNNRGELYSVDLPPEAKDSGSYLPDGQQLGFLVPEDLYQRWHIVLGDAKEILPSLLAKLVQIDIFLHDSLHSPGHMKFEYQTAWPFIKQGGMLLSHDVSMPWISFCRRLGTLPYHYGRLGGMVKHKSLLDI